MGFVVEVSQDRGRPVEGPVVVKKIGVRDDLKQGGANGEGVDGARWVIRRDAEQNLTDSIIDQRVEAELRWRWIHGGWLGASCPIALSALVAKGRRLEAVWCHGNME